MEKRDVATVVQNGRKQLHAEWGLFDGFKTDQEKGIPVPAQEKPVPPGTLTIGLPTANTFQIGAMPLIEALRSRRSRRKFTDDALSLEELSFLLWATQGVAERSPRRSLRTAPSAGARHALETYLFLPRVTDVAPGIWRYQAFDHAIVLLRTGTDLAAQVHEALMEQSYGAAAIFMWTAIPYRMEWRYAPVAHKLIALDAGHVCENLYLACESIGCGTCAIGAYNQEAMDAFLGIDGEEEFALYAAPVGRREKR
jgi:SagB-type dehydrogenase family enzyme